MSRAALSPEQRALENQKNREYQHTDKGKEARKIANRNYYQKKREEKCKMKELEEEVEQQRQNTRRLNTKLGNAVAEADFFKVKCFKKQSQKVPFKDMITDQANKHAEVPLLMQAVADQFRDNKPSMVMSVLKRSVPEIEKRIQQLEARDEEWSDYSRQLDEIEVREEQIKDFGLVKVSEQKWEEIQNYVKVGDDDYEKLSQAYDRLDSKYKALVKRRSFLTQEARNELIEDNKKLRK